MMSSMSAQLVLDTVARCGSREFLVSENAVLTYHDLDDRARRIGAWLRAAGLQPGDRLAVLLPNGIACSPCTSVASTAASLPCP